MRGEISKIGNITQKWADLLMLFSKIPKEKCKYFIYNCIQNINEELIC